MRADVLRTSLLGIQRRRLRGLGVMPSLTMPMIPSSGGRVGSDPDRTAYRVAEGTTYRVADATIAPPLMHMVGPLSSAFIGAVSATPGVTVMPGVRFGEGPGVTPMRGDPLGTGAETTETSDAAAEDRADAGGYVAADGTPVSSSTGSATPDLWSRYKWWILGFFVTLTGAGGLWAWRMARGRR